MSVYELHKYSGAKYEARQKIIFPDDTVISEADLDEEMKKHIGVDSVIVSRLTQNAFNYFIERYGDQFESIYFFHNTAVKDLSALSQLKKVKYLLFYNVRAASLWDMRNNKNLKGIMISESKKMLYDLEELQYAPNLEELLLFSAMFNKYTVKSVIPLTKCKKLKRLFMEFNTEDKSFDPKDFGSLDVFEYQCDRQRNFTY